MQRGPELLPWNRSHPHLTGAGSPITPIHSLPHRVLLHPWHLYLAMPPTHSPVGPHSVQPPSSTHRRGLIWPPRCLSRSPALAERGTCPSGGLYPKPRRGGAGRSLRLRQARAQHRAPPRFQRVSSKTGCQEQKRGALDRGAKATGEARRAAGGLRGSVARDGGIARDVAPPCGQGAGALRLWVVRAACTPLQASTWCEAGGL